MKIEVAKSIELQEGEELMEFVQRVHEALAVNRAKTKLSLFLHKVFNEHIIARDYEQGRFFKF